MFRKPKRKVKDTLRKKDDAESFGDAGNVNSEVDDDDAAETLRDIERSKREKSNHSTTTITDATMNMSSTTKSRQQESIMHTYDSAMMNHQTNSTATGAVRDLVTSVAEHHPATATGSDNSDTLLVRNDGIYRGDQVRNKFHAGPIRAATHVRITARFDYQPDICKDYKETGFCGYGDTCIYLHDRTDTVSGWQLERQWEDQQKAKKEKQEQIMNNFATGTGNHTDGAGDNQNALLLQTDDGIPFACHICREHFKDPVVTNCLHYFCEKCIMDHVRTISEACPICNKETGSVFNLPNKLIAKKRKVLGRQQDDDENDSWLKYFQSFREGTKN